MEAPFLFFWFLIKTRRKLSLHGNTILHHTSLDIKSFRDLIPIYYHIIIMYRKVEESQTLLINTQSKKLVEDNREVIKFGFGQSPFLPPKKCSEGLEKVSSPKGIFLGPGQP